MRVPQSNMITTPLGPMAATPARLRKLRKLQHLRAQRQDAQVAAQMAASPLWRPIPPKNGEISRQELAFLSLADILGYGGAAGGGKSDLMFGTAITSHQRAVIFRRQRADLQGTGGLIERAHAVLDGKAHWNGSLFTWKIPGGRMLSFGHMQHPGDEKDQKGRRRDFWGFDEVTDFQENQVRFVLGWMGTDTPGQRSRAIMTFNPPTTQEGQWVIDYFGPWLNKQHPNPAKPGELRWYASLPNGKEIERPDGKPFEFQADDGETELIKPLSRTFIPARVEDNPYLMATGYKASLQAMPEPLRSLMLKGDFAASFQDDAWQVFPTNWVLLAQQRWRALEDDGFKPQGPPDDVGVDPARGGGDECVYTPRWGSYFGAQTVVPGKATPDGQAVLRTAIPILGKSKGPLKVDVIGIGSSPVDIARMLKIKVLALNGAQRSSQMDKSKKLRFHNKRAEWAWKFREALDPDSGEDIALPDDPRIRADLCSMRWELASTGVKLVPKEETKELIGRSPDRGESTVYAHAQDSDTPPIVGGLVFTRAREVPG